MPEASPADAETVRASGELVSGGAPSTRTVRPTRRVLGLLALLAAVGAVLWTAVQQHPPAPPAGLQLPWWLLALMFAATELWVFHIQVGREAESISISEVPLVLALFYAVPEDLLVARVVGPALVMLLHRRQTLLKSGVNISLVFADTTVALCVFRLVGGGSTADGSREWVGAVLAAACAMAVDLAVLNLIIRWYDGAPPLSGLRSVVTGVGIAAASALLGLVPVLTLRLGALSAVPLFAAGVVLMLGYRAYASLAERHNSLERLFRFSRELHVAPESDDVLPSVLAQARDLLRGETAEVLRFGAGDDASLWRFDGSRVDPLPASTAAVTARLVREALRDGQAVMLRRDGGVDHGYLRVRQADEALVAPLRYDGQVVGALAVHDRLGEVRGFTAADLQLLQTVANHASVALHNEMLIGRLRHDALHDALTGLPNRAQLTADAQAVLAEARSVGAPAAIMIIDLNGFKAVNDTLGHHVGDELIQQVAARFTAAAPPDVTVARLGGDEFAVLTRPAAPDRPGEVARALLDALEAPFLLGDERLHLSGSAGIALTPDHGVTVSDLLKRADIAMYAAKNGAEGAVVYRPDIDLNDPSLLSLMGELREAMGSGQIDIEVEPVVDLTTGAVYSAEALLRWHHPTRGTLRPGVFLPLAERNGLIVPLTELVLDRAVAACAAWLRDGFEVGISVNLSARSLLDPMLPAAVRDTLGRHGLPSRLLTLEITESIVLSDAERALSLLADLRELGVRLSLDDFGTGYSSLTHLSGLPIQQLKIDRSFVSQIHDSPRDSAIVSAVTRLAADLDIEVVAEGVETERTAERLRELGCTLGQGHHYATSMSPGLLPSWARNRPLADPPSTPRTRLLRSVR